MNEKSKTKKQLIEEIKHLTDQLDAFKSVERMRYSTDMALKESEERFARMIQAAPLGIHINRLV